jgi:phage FluMu protein Com
MPCMCGDTYCHSCGPAQGNHKCYICGAWDADGGCENPEECAKKDKEWAEAEMAQHEMYRCPKCKSTNTQYQGFSDYDKAIFMCRSCKHSWEID